MKFRVTMVVEVSPLPDEEINIQEVHSGAEQFASDLLKEPGITRAEVKVEELAE
jgi:hypothetical protein